MMLNLTTAGKKSESQRARRAFYLLFVFARHEAILGYTVNLLIALLAGDRHAIARNDAVVITV